MDHGWGLPRGRREGVGVMKDKEPKFEDLLCTIINEEGGDG